MRYVVIMAGGSGERFWPLSRMQRPKQLLSLTSPKYTMLEEAIARIEPLVPIENILIITSELLRQPIIDAMPDLPAANVIAEPAKRNTASCLALACAVIDARTPDSANVMAVLTADHFIGDADAFRHDVNEALDYAERHDALVTMGIPPTRPETGYGYIQIDRQHAHPASPEAPVSKVLLFKEKPDFATATSYVLSGDYLWNSGMFFWRVGTLADAMKQHLPAVGSAIEPMTKAIAMQATDELSTIFGALPDISIDHGVMEHAGNVYVIPASFPWDDVGSWDALDRMRGCDSENNVTQGDVVALDTKNSIVVNAHDGRHVVTALGLDDLVIVVTNEATMICHKSRAQDVKKVVATLRSGGASDVL